MKKITKKEAKKTLQKYNIEFGFPQDTKNGELITVWSDHYHNTKNNAGQLRELIDNDSDCPFYTFPDIMMSTFRLKRKN